MKDRLILEQIDSENKTAVIRGVRYGLCGGDFPTVKECGSHLTEKEKAVISYLSFAFTRSERLGRHIRFLYERGEMYTVYNGNLLFHGSIPMTESGEFLPLPAAGGLSGKALMDFCDKTARQGYFAKVGSAERTWGMDFLWFLWCGKNSPLSGRERIASFERLMIKEKSAHEEPKNAYYRVWEDEGLAKKILEEFGLTGASAHIVNGHIPVNKGEDPLKAGGRLIVIDGGFCKAYHGTTGIGGYTLIYNADGMRLVAHSPIKEVGINADDSILSERWIYTHRPDKMRIREGDEGAKIREQLFDLVRLIREYERGNIKESGLPSKLGSPK